MNKEEIEKDILKAMEGKDCYIDASNPQEAVYLLEGVKVPIKGSATEGRPKPPNYGASNKGIWIKQHHAFNAKSGSPKYLAALILADAEIMNQQYSFEGMILMYPVLQVIIDL